VGRIVLGPYLANAAPGVAADPVARHAGGRDQDQLAAGGFAQGRLRQPRAEGRIAQLALQGLAGLDPNRAHGGDLACVSLGRHLEKAPFRISVADPGVRAPREPPKRFKHRDLTAERKRPPSPSFNRQKKEEEPSRCSN
jgi:hypothetical protein